MENTNSFDLENFDAIREKNIMRIKKAKEQGQNVIGFYCTYAPRELIEAAGALAVVLCGTRNEPIAAAEADLPSNLCPLIKSSYGFAITDTCPFFHFSDFIIGETTCDGKKKMLEILDDVKPTYIMHLPQEQQSEAALELMRREIIKLKEHIENTLDVEITDDAVRKAIKINNQYIKTQKKLLDLNQHQPALISGSDLLRVMWQSGFHTNRSERIKMFESLIADIESKKATQDFAGDINTPRLLVTGTPIGLGCEKVITIAEECGAVVVVQEHCGAYKTVSLLNDEELAKTDPYLALAKRYLKIPCSVMSPNSDRFNLIKNISQDFSIDGIIDLSWQACHTYNIESTSLKKFVNQELGLPLLHLETDYSEADIEQLRVRIGAFVETLQ